MFTEVTFRIGRSFSSNYDRQALLTELAREAGVNHRTARLHVRELEKLNVLKTEEKGKLVYVRPARTNQFYQFIAAAENYFAFSDGRPEILKLHERFSGKFCIVFGSFASHEETELSDVDVLCDSSVDAEDFLHPAQFFEFSSLRKVPDRLFKEVLKKHIIVKGVDMFIEEVKRRYG